MMLMLFWVSETFLKSIFWSAFSYQKTQVSTIFQVSTISRPIFEILGGLIEKEGKKNRHAGRSENQNKIAIWHGPNRLSGKKT
jgi:hypothetical protein